MSIRVLHVFSTFEMGGPQARFAGMLGSWPPDAEHVILAMDGRHHALEAVPRESRVRIVELPISKGSGLGNRTSLRRLIRSNTPDCVVTYNWGAIEALLANFPRIARHVHVEDGFGPEEAAGRLPRRSLARRIFFRLTGATVIVPSTTLERIATEEWSVSPRRLRLIVNGVRAARADDAHGEPAVAGLEEWARGRPICVAIGALRAEKRFDRIPEIAKLVPDAVFAIGGEGPERPQIEAAIRAHGVESRVRMLGHLSRPRALLCRAFCFVLTSDTEQLPMALLEAMSHALPVVATDVGDIRRTLAEDNGSWVVPRDVNALASALDALITDLAKARAAGAANEGRVADLYSHAAMCARWWDAIAGEPAAV